MNTIVGVRKDYLKHDGHLYSSLSESFGKASAIRRYFFLTTEGPKVATCRKHQGGSRNRFLHPPLNPVTGPFLSSINAQISHVVMQPHVVKKQKAHQYNTTYEVRQIDGGYRGIYSANVVDYGDFNLDTPLHCANTLLSVGRKDIQLLLHRMVRRGIATRRLRDDLLRASKVLHDNLDSRPSDKQNSTETKRLRSMLGCSKEEAVLGATSLSLIDAVKLESIMSKSHSCKDEISKYMYLFHFAS